MTTEQVTALCPNGQPDPGYSCRFCHVRLHRGDSGCGCSEHRPKVTYFASLCHTCAQCIDTLMEETPLGRVHRALVQEALMKYMPGND